ncbi:phage capsid protein [Cereibacter azotoformans]|uniref:Phage major capsid protein n=1 Tax=Cereibacter sphaeroides (strain ATCC 17025 / ATH 2.4.3) TaxID=349102 RepID=A4WPM9_CERS5|nr:phage capsid protein [Cereibacter azotoformans]ULB08745.1 phage capsid protein [Cereibacter azotoformans]
MPQSMLVEAHHRLMYANSVTMVAQQTRDPFAGAVTDASATGEAQSVTDLVDAGEYAYGEERSRRNPEMPISGGRRWVVMPPVIESGQYIDKEDKFRTATDPTSVIVTTHTKRVIRGKADRTLGIRKAEDGTYAVLDGGILGYATEGKRGTSQVGLPSSQFVPVGTTGLTLDKLRDAVKTLKLADFGMEDDDPLYCAITPNQEDDLLAIAAASGANLNTFSIDQLRTGKPTMLMGVNWLLTNRVPVDAADSRLCPIWSKKNIVRGIWQDVEGDMWNDTHAKNLPYAYVSAYIDCVRVQDKGVIVIECKE